MSLTSPKLWVVATPLGNPGDLSPRAREVLEMVELSGKEEQMVDSLSRGIQQRLCLARAMIHKPKLLVLDEPNSGLDTRSRKDFQLLLQRLAREDYTILISSHILSEITSICDHVMIISHGKLVASDTPENLGHYMKNSDMMELQIRGSREACEKARELLKKVKGLVIKTAAASLEDVFLELTSGDPETAET